MAAKCNTCQHCEPAPAHENYADAYGWCMAPVPIHVLDRQPLIRKAELKGKTCAMYQRREERTTAVINTTDFAKDFPAGFKGQIAGIQAGAPCPKPDCTGVIRYDGESLYCDDEFCPLYVKLEKEDPMTTKQPTYLMAVTEVDGNVSSPNMLAGRIAFTCNWTINIKPVMVLLTYRTPDDALAVYLCGSIEEAEAKAVELVNETVPVRDMADITDLEVTGWGGAIDIKTIRPEEVIWMAGE
ncbi:MAG: hypothetical protein FOGNACKC_00847 [Anaerolineae bacterium]|nr:hypothetical protein [Anaerolineae bacterium]